MKTIEAIDKHFNTRKHELNKQGIDVTKVYMSRNIFYTLHNEESFYRENFMKESEDYTFRGFPIIIVLDDNYFDVGV